VYLAVKREGVADRYF